MNKVILFIAILAAGHLFTACEGCVNSAARKATNLGLSALEGVASAVAERGDTIGEKLTDAMGTIAQGAGRSLDRQLNEHAEEVAAAAGRTLVQTAAGLEGGIKTEQYDEIVSKEELPGGMSLLFFGKVKTTPVTDAHFIITESGTYTAKFEFCTDNCRTVVLTKTAEMQSQSAGKEYRTVSFAYNDEELALLASARCTKITVTRQ